VSDKQRYLAMATIAAAGQPPRQWCESFQQLLTCVISLVRGARRQRRRPHRTPTLLGFAVVSSVLAIALSVGLLALLDNGRCDPTLNSATGAYDAPNLEVFQSTSCVLIRKSRRLRSLVRHVSYIRR
jgi:hypothetical protein